MPLPFDVITPSPWAVVDVKLRTMFVVPTEGTFTTSAGVDDFLQPDTIMEKKSADRNVKRK